MLVIAVIPSPFKDISTKASLINFKVVSPDIGLVLQKGPRKDRQSRPLFVQRLSRVFMFADAPFALARYCFLCACAGGDLFTCTVCLCTFHKGCTSKYTPLESLSGEFSCGLLASCFNTSNMCRFCCTAFGI